MPRTISVTLAILALLGATTAQITLRRHQPKRPRRTRASGQTKQPFASKTESGVTVE
jgi:hypothetical protein